MVIFEEKELQLIYTFDRNAKIDFVIIKRNEAKIIEH